MGTISSSIAVQGHDQAGHCCFQIGAGACVLHLGPNEPKTKPTDAATDLETTTPSPVVVPDSAITLEPDRPSCVGNGEEMDSGTAATTPRRHGSGRRSARSSARRRSGRGSTKAGGGGGGRRAGNGGRQARPAKNKTAPVGSKSENRARKALRSRVGDVSKPDSGLRKSMQEQGHPEVVSRRLQTKTETREQQH